MASKITVAASPLTRKIYAGKAKPHTNPAEPRQWHTKEDVTQEAVIAVATHLGQPGAYLELNGPGQPTMMLALLSAEDFTLLETARLEKEKAGKA